LVTLIINPISGARLWGELADRVEVARAALAATQDTRIVVSERRGHVRELAAAAVSAGSQLVMVWGGDGSMNEAASALAGTGIPLGLVPAGSGNGLARDLRIPLQPAAAIAAALRGKPRVIDGGDVNGRLFFNVAGVGLDAHIASCFDRAPRRGLRTYLQISARELMSYVPTNYRIAHDEGLDHPSGIAARVAPTHRRAVLVTIANSPQFGNGARIAPAARVDDGRLDLVVYEEVSRFSTICAAPRLFTGGIERVRGFTTCQIVRARIESDQPMRFHVDGEPADGGTALDVRVVPGALSVIV
jgi:diacylglycerol kinase family enzyme